MSRKAYTSLGLHPGTHSSVILKNYISQIVASRMAIVATLAIALWFWSTPYTFAQSGPGITSPAAGSEVSGSVSIIGTAVIEPFQRYELYIKQEPNGDDAYIYMDGGTQPVTNGQLGVIDTNAFAPGVYSIRLRVVKLDGNYAEYFAPNLSFNQGPTATPTSSEPTPTPIPSATFTPAPQPTPVLGEVTQPQVEGDALVNTATPEPIAAADTNNAAGSENVDANSANANTGSSTTGLSTTGAGASGAVLPNTSAAGEEVDANGFSSQISAAIGIDKLRNQFFTGVRYSAAAFVLIGILFLSKGIIRWMRAQL